MENEKEFKKIVDYIETTDLEYQLFHKIDLVNLKRNKCCIVIDNSLCKKYFILLRTRNINIDKQIEILSHIN